MIRKTKIFLVTIVLNIVMIISFTSCYGRIIDNNIIEEQHDSNQVPESKDENNKAQELIDDTFIDKSYKIYYGEWQIKEMCGEHERLGAHEDADELIGTKIYFNYDKVMINDELAITNPKYRISILPSSIDYYTPYMPSHKEFGIVGNYFTYVSVYTGGESNPLLISAGFYVKDDETLLLESNDAYYRVERIGYIPDVERYYESF
ncbi:hypothetical protein EDC19_1387 [Natranaerovirga hydrolytica]|uniref:Lipoprotein n=1 Tax=Natranaerovirga hydrolytica TaxID=680378 RepID=A0A4R1MK66_9FIRM|nr:hypothetical protein [Natranaerovirga hydrolytica]TCK93198.1 hypothetical protein EDC19_1387 [Natranaerovirga hydrolytica]